MNTKTFNNKEDFLLDTLEYYLADPQARVNLVEGTCQYTPLKDTSDGCAIGRFLTKENQRRLDEDAVYASILSMEDKDFKECIPEWMQKFGRDFLQAVQSFHDNLLDTNYLSEGNNLSEIGIRQLDCIITQYKLDEDKFEKYLVD